MDDCTYHKYLNILKDELVPALGCTEPIAIAYASAAAVKALGKFPEHMTAACSGNIIKNVKSVIVPNTCGQKGIEVAAAIGAVGGNADKKLEVLSDVTTDDAEQAKKLVEQGFCSVEVLKGNATLHIIMTAYCGSDKASVEIINEHTNIVCVMKNDSVLFEKKCSEVIEKSTNSREFMSIEGIIEFADIVKIEDIKELLDRQIEYNTAISEEGLNNKYGANVGQTLLSAYDDTDVKVRARARAAAGSDARMSGCVLPVIINSGSGNQGITVSLPVIEYAENLGASHEKLYRALVVSNLAAIHQKTGIGKLSAYCGAVCASCGSGAGIAYLEGADYNEISDTIVNTLANVSGIVCDGAKPSCAAKIASAVDAAIMGYLMAHKKRKFMPGEGIVNKNVEATIKNVGQLARLGMKETDEEVLKIMTK